MSARATTGSGPVAPPAGGLRSPRPRGPVFALTVLVALVLAACATAPTVQIGGQPPPPSSGRGVNAYGFP